MEVTPSDITWSGPAPGGDGVPAIAGYRILGRLGQGGQGAVFLAERLCDGRRAAVKVLHAGEREARRRFQREIALSRSFAHPNVVKILDGSLANDHGDPWLAMEYLEGCTLADAVGEGPLGEVRVRALARDMARGLEYLHLRGLIHRDLKPANVFLEDEGRAILLDFGLATGDELTRMTATSDIPGTFVAMAPEQLLCKPLSPATDVYQLGFTLFVALTGTPPFAVDELVRGVSTGVWAQPPSPSLASGCSAELSDLVLSCLQADPGRRPADGTAVLAILEPSSDDGEPLPSVRPVAETVSSEPSRRGRPLVGVALLMVGLVLGLAAVGQWGRRGDQGGDSAPAAVSAQDELLAACYGGVEGPDATAVGALLDELDALADPRVEVGLRSSLARDWRDAARRLAEGDPGRSLVEAALHLRDGAREKAAAALVRAMESQRQLLTERGPALTPPQLALEGLLLARWVPLALDTDEPGPTHRALDEGDRFVVALPVATDTAPSAASLRLLSLAARWCLWGRQGAAGAASREDAAPGLAVAAVGVPAATLAALPRWCLTACDEAAASADPAIMERCVDGTGARELAAEVRREAREAAHRLNEINHDVDAVAGGRTSWVITVASEALRRLRRSYWLARALAWRPAAEPVAASALCFAASAVVEIRLRGRLSDVAVEGRWGEGFEPDVLVDGALAALVRVLRALPGLEGDAAMASAATEWWMRSSYLRERVAGSRRRMSEVCAARPLLGAMLAVVAASESADVAARASSSADLMRRAQAVLGGGRSNSADLALACEVLVEGLGRGWFIPSPGQVIEEAEAQAAWLVEALDAPARAPGASPALRRLWALAVMVVANARLSSPGSSVADETWRPLAERLREVASTARSIDGAEGMTKLVAELGAGRPVWHVVGSAR